MQVPLVNIGNSRGIRIPKPLIEAAGLADAVNLELRDRSLVIEPVRQPRAGWGSAFAAMHTQGDDTLLDEPVATDFEDDAWQWEK